MQSKSVLLKNMFDPEESVGRMSLYNGLLMKALFFRETERDWDKDLADDVKSEVEEKYGRVDFIKVEKESQVCLSHCPMVMVSSRVTGRDLREIRFHRVREEGYRGTQRQVVRRKTSLRRIHFGCHPASSPIDAAV